MVVFFRWDQIGPRSPMGLRLQHKSTKDCSRNPARPRPPQNMLAVIFLTIFCTGVSADCYIPPSPSAEAFFNVAEKKFIVTSYSNKAGWGTRIVFFPKDGASFDLSTGEISVNIELNMDCGPKMCSGMAWGGYSMDDYCEDNGGLRRAQGPDGAMTASRYCLMMCYLPLPLRPIPLRPIPLRPILL